MSTLLIDPKFCLLHSNVSFRADVLGEQRKYLYVCFQEPFRDAHMNFEFYMGSNTHFHVVLKRHSFFNIYFYFVCVERCMYVHHMHA